MEFIFGEMRIVRIPTALYNSLPLPERNQAFLINDIVCQAARILDENLPGKNNR